MRRVVTLGILVILAAALLAVPGAQAAEPKGGAPQVVIVVIGGLGPADVAAGPMPFTRTLMERGGVGLANTLGVGKAEMNRSSATVGAGARAKIDTNVDPAMNSSETIEGATAEEVYRRRLGYLSSGYQVLDVGLAELDAQNRGLPYHMVPGALGDAVRQGGGSSAVFGNSDTSTTPGAETSHRDGAYIAMDAKGRVRYGDVGASVLATSTAAPFGIRADLDRLVGGYTSVRDKAQLVVLEFGDLARAEAYRPVAKPRVAARQRADAVVGADRLLERLVPKLRSGSVLVVMSPMGPGSGGANSLTPIVFVGPGFRPGLLSSPVTQRPGLVNATDIAPTVLASLGLPRRTEFLGATITSDGRGGAVAARLEGLTALYRRASAEAGLRSTVTGMFTVVLTLVFVGVVALLFASKISRHALLMSRWLLLAVVSAPLAAYLMWLVRSSDSSQAGMIVTFICLMALIPAVASIASRSSSDALIKICSATALYISVDQVLFGGRLIMSTFYGYSPIDGARYYGIGNETWAVLVGALIVAAALWTDGTLSRSTVTAWVVPLMFCGAIFIIGFPAVGANAGGVIGATAALATTYLHLRDSRLGLKQAVLIILAIILVLGAFTFYDTLRPVSLETHIGRSARLIAGKNGAAEFVLLVQRKLMSNLKVMARTRWSYVLLLLLAVLVVVRRRPTGLFAETLEKQPGLAAALAGGLVGGVVGLVTEDSGVVIPAMMMLFVGTALTAAMVETKFEMQKELGTGEAEPGRR